MALDNIMLVSFIVCVFASFGCVLGFVSHEESRNRRKAGR